MFWLVVILAVGTAVVHFAGDRLQNVAEVVRAAPGRTALVGLAGGFLLLPLWVLGGLALLVSIIGIPLLVAWLPLFPLAALLAGGLGYLAVASVVGEWLARKGIPALDRFRPSNRLHVLAVGLAALVLPSALSHVTEMGGPTLGSFLSGLFTLVAVATAMIALMLGFGAVLLTGRAALPTPAGWQRRTAGEFGRRGRGPGGVPGGARARNPDTPTMEVPVTNSPWMNPRAHRERRGAGLARLTCAAIGGLACTATGLTAQDWSTVTASRQLGGEREIQVHVEYGAGVLDLGPGEPGTLYRMELRYDRDTMEPETRYEDGILEIGMDRVGRGIRMGSRDGSGRLDLELSPEVPLLLDLQFGAARADLDLGRARNPGVECRDGGFRYAHRGVDAQPVELELASFEAGAANLVATGLGNLNAERIRLAAKAGKATLDFDGEWQRDADVDLDLDLGAVELRFPRGLGVQLVVDALLTSVDAQEMFRRGDSYYSADWDDAETRLTMEIDAHIGAIDVVWIP